MRSLMVWTIIIGGLSVTTATADPPQRSLPSVTAKELDDFHAKLKQDPQHLAKRLAQDRDKVEALIRAGQKQRPAARLWAMDVQTLFAVDVFIGKSLVGEEKTAHFKHALEYLQESYDVAVRLLNEAPDERLQGVLPGLHNALALAALEAGKIELAKEHAVKTLSTDIDGKNWKYGNIIHNANQILGHCALREGKLARAKIYLLKAGATPGSPQLNSFGPQMQLARELLQKGEKETVLQYLDLVSEFWNSDKAQSKIGRWKGEIAEGKIPTGAQWR